MGQVSSRGQKMGFSGKIVKSTGLVTVVLLVSACVAKQDLILPSKEQRISAVDAYKKCVSYATNISINKSRNQDAEAIVRASIHQCRTSKHAMLKDYPKNWRASFERQVDNEILKEEVAYVRKTRGQ